MADRNTKIRGIQINAEVAGSGLAKDGSGNLAINLETSNPGLAITDDKLDIKLVANDGLAKGVSGVSVDYDNATIGIISNKLAVKADAITEPKLAMNDAPANGEVITWNTTGDGYMEWTAKTAVDTVAEADLVMENLSVTCDGIETDFVLDYTPVANSLQVFLCGLLQEEGTGKDYTLATATISFAIAPESNDNLIVHYVK